LHLIRTITPDHHPNIRQTMHNENEAGYKGRYRSAEQEGNWESKAATPWAITAARNREVTMAAEIVAASVSCAPVSAWPRATTTSRAQPLCPCLRCLLAQ
jgi:hypothetical protein